MQSVLQIHSGYLNRLSRVTSLTSLKSFGNFVPSAQGSQANRSSTLSPRCAALASPPRKGPRRTRRAPQTQQQPDHRTQLRRRRDVSDGRAIVEKDTLDWGNDSMRPSAALQERLKGLQSTAPAFVSAEEEDAEEQPGFSGMPSNGPAVETASFEAAESELQLPRAIHVRVKTAEYVTSSVELGQCPQPRFPEIAVVGRSNVGKSSLINLITGRRELALVSKTPGKTKCINHFLINGSWYLVDLPGYGYAKSGKTKRAEWGKFTQDYFKKRETLVNVLLLVDASVPTQNIDLGCAEWLAQNQVPFTLVFTKMDKRKKRCPSPEENIAAFEAELSNVIGDLPLSVTTSASDKRGKDDLLRLLAQLRAQQAD